MITHFPVGLGVGPLIPLHVWVFAIFHIPRATLKKSTEFLSVLSICLYARFNNILTGRQTTVWKVEQAAYHFMMYESLL